MAFILPCYERSSCYYYYIESKQRIRGSKMDKFTTKQLKEAMISLCSLKDDASFRAYQMVFDELHSRLGDEAFDSFCDAYS